VDGERQAGGLGFALRDAYPWDGLVGLARTGVALGYGALFLPEVGARDVLAALTGLAGEIPAPTLLGSGVVPLPSRQLELLAAAAMTAQERSGGRLLLGLGTGPAVPGALDRLRESVLALRTLFRDGEASLRGETLELDRLPAEPPPIWIAALGPRAVRLAGQVADGVLLNWCTPERVAQARIAIAGGAADAGRDPARVTVAVYVRAALAEDTWPAALDAAATYGAYPGYARQFAVMGIDPADPEAVAAAVILRGDRDRARARLDAFREAGADLPVVYPVIRRAAGGHGPDPDPEDAATTLRELAP